MNTYAASHERYQRQVLLPQLGLEGQERLLSARVLMMGAGGLGCPVLQYLAAAGVGHIGIADGDVVRMSNLHRQILYEEQHIGALKAVVAKDRLLAMNPGISITAFPIHLSPANALEVIRDFDIVVDGSDNFATRYLINDACVLLGKTLVLGALTQFEGQVAVLNTPGEGSVNYRDIFPNPPQPDEVKNCAEAGVLGVLPGIIGTMMANEVIKIITGIGETLVNKLLIFNALNNQSYQLALSPAPGTREKIPDDEQQFSTTDYEWFCGTKQHPLEIDQTRFRQLVTTPGVMVIDVREPGELPVVTAFTHQQIPLWQLQYHLDQLTADTILVFCQSGGRSLKAAQLLFEKFGNEKKIYSLKGGISQYEQTTHA